MTFDGVRRWPVIELRPEPEGWMSHIWRWLDGEWRRVTDEPIPTAQAQGEAAYMRLRAEIAGAHPECPVNGNGNGEVA